MISINSNSFDFIRFFFAFNVLLAHLKELSQSDDLLFLGHFSNSFIAVNGFFVISGFLVAKSYTNTPSLRTYFLKRIKRILPAYVFVVLFSIFFFSFFSKFDFFQYFTDPQLFEYLGWNMIFLNFMQPCLPALFDNTIICAVNGSLWTIKVEESFYFFLPLLFFFIKRSNKPILILIIVYIFSILYFYFFKSYLGMPLIAKQLPGVLSYFSTGIFLFLYLKILIRYKIQLLLFSIFVFIFSIKFSVFFLYPISFGFVVILLAYSLPFFNNFGKYGDFTFGLYICHFPIIQLFKQLNYFEIYNPFYIGFLVVILSLLFSIFSWFVIEKRFLDRYKKTAVK
ncbi:MULTISPECIES: acyltransferase family protein [Flavobacterium]|uniref:Acyltransferase family protein n=1 Tax=Flavobacterium jumunjinense TaxID=998845 RepID=A0ABV5GQX7_9FLAO